jgi:[acyl-carrier-protein] S-malonyltransferase
MKTAFLFPGQGAQNVGMGKDVADAFPEAAEIFEKANKIVGFDLSSICFHGPAEKLNTTTISQPAIFVASAAILEVLRTHPPATDIKADVTAGLSLGEYTALYAAGVISFEDALILVQKRGQAMQAAADATEGAMVSIIGLDEAKVAQLCDEARENEILEAVNFNCPGQIVVSGSKTACERAEKLAEKYGAMKAIRLEVAGAFHTEMMSSAADALGEALQKTKISNPSNIKIIANINAQYYKSAEEIRQGLKRQLTNPILWQKCMERLIAEGVEKFYEIGPGRVLTGLMKRIDRKIKVVNISSAQSLNEILVR